MNLENLKVWTTALRSDAYLQVDGALAKQEAEGEPWKHCCLGVGCEIAGIESVVVGCEVDDDGTAISWEKAYGQAESTELPPHSFHEWLGLTPDDVGETDDVRLDWPDEYDSLDQQERGRGGRVVYLTDANMTCANLNDSLNLTFPQIADMLDYFGVRAP